MPSTTTRLSRGQRAGLAELLQSRLTAFEQDRASQLQGLTQAESARQTLLQDADDARQRAGEHEVEGIVLDIGSEEYKATLQALQRIHGADYGLCIDCGIAIPFARLQLEPQTLRCTACQSVDERTNLS